MGDSQYLRKISLIVYAALTPDREGLFGIDVMRPSAGLELGEFRVRFEVYAQDNETPNTAYIRVYNLSDDTMAKIKGEFTRVVLQAGYETGNFGVIFQGNVKQYITGRESPVDTFLDIYAADGDQAYLETVVNRTLGPGITPKDILAAQQRAAAEFGVRGDDRGIVYSGALPRGKVLFGLWREEMREFATTQGVKWSIQNGVITIVPLDGYLPREAVVLNMSTGLIGVPEATDVGIAVRCLINPRIQVGTLLKINNKSITQTQIVEQFFPGYQEMNFVADISKHDGTYRVLVIEHVGDNRDIPWYSNITCLAVDLSATSGNQVLPYGPQQPGN